MDQTYYDKMGGVLIPGLTADQSENTVLFLDKAADTYHTPYHVLVMERHIRRRDAYSRHRDPETGKLVYNYRDGEKICIGRAGVDWSKPAIYDLAGGRELYREHPYPYPQLRVTKAGKEYIYKTRPSLLETVLSSSASRSYLFYPVLVRKRPIMEQAVAGNGDKYWMPKNYATVDVAAARCAWVDIDGHDLPLDEIKVINPFAIARLMGMLPEYCAETGVPMPAVINSGRGIHLYWWFREAEELKNNEDLRRFKNCLNALGIWADQLIRRDEICARAWQADSAASAIFHQMNLPGCVHPKTGTRRYVVNKYGRDYVDCDYAALCDALGVLDPLPISCTPLPPEPSEAVIPVEADAVPACDPSPAVAAGGYPANPGRLNRLMDWASGRGWDLYPGREKFLFIAGVLLHQTDPTLRGDRTDHPLYGINRQLTDPLPDAEVAGIIRTLTQKAARGTDAYSSGYIFSNSSIADFLNMTAAEQARFCTAAPCANTPRKGGFYPVFYEFLDAQRWNPQAEPYLEFKNRCYRQAVAWLAENRTPREHNAARTRRRAAREGYTGKPGRPGKDHSEESNRCRALREEGLTQKQIAATLGISQSKVSKLLRNIPKKED